MIAVLDDDPTGSQTVYGATIVTALDELADDPLTFYLTNTRSLPEDAAVELTYDLARRLFEHDPAIELISRSDSTLRGHVLPEVRAIDRARRDVLGEGYDGVLLIPAFFEAGRATRGDVHYAGDTPVGETEFARDTTFGFKASNLVDFVAEQGGGEALSLSADSTDALGEVRDGRWIVVNAESYADLDAVVAAARASGRTLLYRTGPSFVRALAGLEERPPLQRIPRRKGHGLVVVGSHVGLTSRQVAAAQERCGLIEVELDVTDLDPAGVGERVARALADGDVLLYTSRERVDGDLAFSRRVSEAVTQVVRRALKAKPGWLIAKGGITSHDVAVHGLGLRRAEVLGQLLPGMISVFRPIDADPDALGMPYVVFAGNVGDEGTLAEIVERIR
ncbi:hypothetical protein OJ997_07885 [Solirubrobacter phytolaccae]|uniref:Four-carbon acid sugar kinase family protein n=1 Tax=Solirubrobacter phytolaccae TaxID=1404360 RepID=A0A9X3N847_9ACTN|nr:four-carbon acid sugar kinase family protein [Solirubrobacter phytolaccae]MDA0180210.1 hypothetical protein [Solirubrobacter phytolaccae]